MDKDSRDEIETLASIARKIITMEEYFDPSPHGEVKPVIRIDGLIDGFSPDEITLIRQMRANRV